MLEEMHERAVGIHIFLATIAAASQ